jgi:streptogrisin C
MQLITAALLAAALFVSSPARAEEPTMQRSAEALAADAASYSAAMGVEAGEAERRLQLQQASVAVTERLRMQYRDRLAGIFIEHSPDWRVVVLLVGEQPAVRLLLPAGDLKVPVELRGGAAKTRAQVLAVIDQYRSEIAAAVPGTRGMGHDPRTGELVVMQRLSAADRPVEQIEAELGRLTGVPVRIRRLQASFENAGAAGGSRLEGLDGSGRRWFCTTGFLVSNGQQEGVTTAAHCPDQLTYRGPDDEERLLKFAGGWGTAYRDVQIHTGVGGAPGIFFVDRERSLARPVTSWLTRPMTRAGDWVCKRGEASGASCSIVEMTDFAPPGELCGGLCSTSWVTVKGPQCRRGDSGAPVFIGTTALGVLKGGAFLKGEDCAFYYYMSVDYLPEDWRLVVSR